MRVLQLVTLVSRDGAFGGPLRVALNQAEELRRRGHEVDLAAGWRGQTPPPRSLDGTPAHLFASYRLCRPMGFSGLVSPGLAWWLTRNLTCYDLVHVHAGRDLISLTSMSIARLRRRPYVAQTHGMVQPDPRPMARTVDLLLARPLLRAARQRFVLTDQEAKGLARVLGQASPLQQLMNGVPEVPHQSTAPVDGPHVLFCARLHRRKRPLAFVQVAEELRRRGVPATFAIVGPDEGELNAVRRAIAASDLGPQVRYEGALDYTDVLARMRSASLYVLPSVDEPFPMSLLEALSLGLPSLCTDSCGIADLLWERRAAMVTEPSVSAMADAAQAVLENEQLREELSVNARRAVADLFSMRAVGDHLEHAYAEAARG